MQQIPFTTKSELVQDQSDFPPLGKNHTFSKKKYVRYHQTSLKNKMNQVKVELEARTDITSILVTRFRDRIGLRIDVEMVQENSLPRFEMKARRVIDKRS